MILSILKIIFSILVAFCIGKLVSKLKLPSILGWLIAGMILGPHAFSVMSDDILNATWYETTVHILECSVGLMIGSELVWNKLKRSGKSIIITTLTQSLGTFLTVSLVFGIVFYITGTPLYLAFVFGGIALATAPAPALSIVREFHTDGPVTKTLIPMAALDDIVGCIIFFTTISVIAGNLSSGDLPAYMIALVVLLPLIIGAFVGFFAGLVLKKERNQTQTLLLLIGMILLASIVGFFFNNVVLPSPVLNFMLIGMAFSAVFSNMVSEERLEQIMDSFNPVLGISMIVVILNLGAPLDYHLILGAGIFTAIYILSRAFGKYFGAYFGAAITKSPKTVKKYLGLTLLPHSGVSLVFTGIAVSVLSSPAPECAKIIQGTIAAAAVINEIIAVIVAKKGFEWAGEMNYGAKTETETTQPKETAPSYTVIAISRMHGSGGRTLGKMLSEQLGIPFYDDEIIARALTSNLHLRKNLEQQENGSSDTQMPFPQSDTKIGISTSDEAFRLQSDIIRELAAKGPCIIVGRCADYVLRDKQQLLKVFVCADEATRKNRIVNLYKEVSEKDSSRISKTDKNRASYYEFYTGQKFGDATNYDICLNTSVLGFEQCVNIIKSAYQTMQTDTHI